MALGLEDTSSKIPLYFVNILIFIAYQLLNFLFVPVFAHNVYW